MRVLFSVRAEPPLQRPVATIGNFDGVHRGHQRILEILGERAAAVDGTSLLITFRPHPQKVLHPDSAPRLIATPEQKQERLQQAGLDALLELPFTRELAALSPQEFARTILVDGLAVREVHIGRNFRFGKDRAGDFETLEELGQAHGFHAAPVEGVRHRGERVSSSRIRKALGEGDVQLAAEMLGRPEELRGRVVPGDGRGVELGFRTANLQVENELVPFTGVYATHLVFDGTEHPSVTNIGSRPTFPGAGTAVETHVLDFEGDLYGREVSLRFLRRLRDEMRFPDVDALRAAIARDVTEARKTFSG